MTHQLPTGCVVSSGERTLLEQPTLAALIGATAAEWAMLEEVLTESYALLMGVYLPPIPGLGVVPRLHPVAIQVFDTLETMRPRLQLLRRLAAWVIPETPLLEELQSAIIPAVEKAGKLRNAIVHAHWGVCADYPDALVLQRRFGRSIVYHEADFNEVIDRIISTRRLLWDFDTRFRSRLSAQSDAG